MKAGFGEEEAEALGRHANQLPNLQLLDGAINNEKRAAMPGEWLAKQIPDQASARHYCEKHLLGELPADLTGFETFYAARRDRLRTVLTGTLTGPTPAIG